MFVNTCLKEVIMLLLLSFFFLFISHLITIFLVINCSGLMPPVYGAVAPSSCLSRSTYGQKCSFSCSKTGYVLEGTSGRVCGHDGAWTGENNTRCRGIQIKHIFGLVSLLFLRSTQKQRTLILIQIGVDCMGQR